MIKIIKVTGESLSPFFVAGDYVLIGKCSYLFGAISEGDIVVFTHPSFGELQQFHVKGSHPLSIDSRQIGPIAAADILGKVIWHIKTPLHSN